jgi:hypothetical protein
MLRVAWACGLFGVAILAACTTDYQKGLDDPTYAGPNALANQVPPGASIDQAGSSSSSGGTAGGPKCGTAATPPAGCTITFKNEVVTALKAGSCGTGVSCHAAGGVPPVINFDDPHATWVSLTNYSAQGGKFYVNPCSLDPTQSKIVANLDPTNPDRGTVMPPSVGLAGAVDTVKKWVACGSPE